MDKNTIKISVIKYLEANHGNSWVWGGQISRAVHEETGHKESVIERHGLRKLREAGILGVDYAQVDGSGPKCSRYRLKPLETMQNSPNLCKNCPCCGVLIGSDHLNWCGDWDIKTELDKIIKPQAEKLNL